MLEFVLSIPYAGSLCAASVYAFLRPHGVYWRSAAGLSVGVAVATLIWRLPALERGQDVEAGFALWFATLVLLAALSVAACGAATLRHLLNAVGARLLV